jgi:hypothetical protein
MTAVYRRLPRRIVPRPCVHTIRKPELIDQRAPDLSMFAFLGRQRLGGMLNYYYRSAA